MNQQTPSQLKQQAISAAKNGDWQAAVDINLALLDGNGQDTNTFNRLAVAYSQLGEKKKAIKQFQAALELDKHNLIAKKHLEKLRNNHQLKAPTFVKQHFIEEPGKTKLVELHRLANKEVLDEISAGQECSLVRKKRYISVEVDGRYLGALPEDISFRLCKLIGRGNGYECFVRSVDHNACCVYVREVKQSKRNHGIHSFPPGKANGLVDDFDEKMLIDDDLPSAKSSDDGAEEISREELE